MSIPNQQQKGSPPSGWSLAGPKRGARIYRHKSQPERRSTLFWTGRVAKTDDWYWNNRAKPRYRRAILRQLTLSSGRLSLTARKLSLTASKDKYYKSLDTYAVNDKTAGQTHIRRSEGFPEVITTGRVVNLTQSEWKYWQRRIRRDREEVWGIDTVYTVPQVDGTMVVITTSSYTAIGGQVYEGEAALTQVIDAALDGHDRTRKVRGNHGSQRVADRDAETDWEWVESTELDEDEFAEAIRQLNDDGKLVWSRHQQTDKTIRYFWQPVEGAESEVARRLGFVPRSKHPGRFQAGS